jgi:CRISPR/Cas system CSM-associated protein Csm4 (group 5 of RAMP superfamily)
MEDLGIEEKPAQQIVSNLEFRGERILLPKIVSEISELTEKDETVIKTEKGKVCVEKV